MVETHQKRSLHPPYCHQFLIRCQVFRLKKEEKNREIVVLLLVLQLFHEIFENEVPYLSTSFKKTCETVLMIAK